MPFSPEPNVEFDSDGYPVVFSSDSTSDTDSLSSSWNTTPSPQTLPSKPCIVFQRAKVSNSPSPTSQLTQALSKKQPEPASIKSPVTNQTGRRVTFAGNPKRPPPPTSNPPLSTKKLPYYHTKDEILYSGKNHHLLVQTLLEQDRLRSERLKMAAAEEIHRRYISPEPSTSTSSSSHSNRSNITISSSPSTNITTPDSSSILLTPSSSTTNPPWTCHNCGTTNSAFDATCWFCKVHSGCVDCTWGYE